jgi:HTH-type transcriptional regulator/antitoxin HigA
MDKIDLHPIRNDADHERALRQVAERMDRPPEPGSPEGDRLEILLTLIEAYEREHHPIDRPDPIAFLEETMDLKGLTRKDLEPSIGSKGRVSEILNRKRRLTTEMIHRLVQAFDLPAEVLVQPYALDPVATPRKRNRKTNVPKPRNPASRAGGATPKAPRKRYRGGKALGKVEEPEE